MNPRRRRFQRIRKRARVSELRARPRLRGVYDVGTVSIIVDGYVMTGLDEINYTETPKKKRRTP